LYTDVDTKAAAPARTTDCLVALLLLLLLLLLDDDAAAVAKSRTSGGGICCVVLGTGRRPRAGVGEDDAAGMLGDAKGWCVLIDSSRGREDCLYMTTSRSCGWCCPIGAKEEGGVEKDEDGGVGSTIKKAAPARKPSSSIWEGPWVKWLPAPKPSNSSFLGLCIESMRTWSWECPPILHSAPPASGALRLYVCKGTMFPLL